MKIYIRKRHYKLVITRRTPLFSISVAAQLCSLPEWTIRLLEREKLLCPARTTGRTRLYSRADLRLLSRVKELIDQDINIQGIKYILRKLEEN